MGKRGFGSKRRTVVQLDDGPRKQPTYGLGYKATEEASVSDGNASALTGLMSQYAEDSNSGDESEAEDVTYNHPVIEDTSNHKGSGKSLLMWQKFVAASDTAPPPPPPDSPPPVSKCAPVAHLKPEGHKADDVNHGPVDDIDLKLQDFLAEIESIEVPKEGDAAIDGIPLPLPEPTAHEAEKPLSEVSAAGVDGGSEEEEDWKGSAPKEPASVWQQCLDEETQCYYYWNYDTNEVTWEIPAEYSQYLLRYQEYEHELKVYEQEYAEWKKTHKRHKSHKKKSKRNKEVVNKPNDEVITPLVSYPPEDEEPEPPVPVYGPFLPPHDTQGKEPPPVKMDEGQSDLNPAEAVKTKVQDGTTTTAVVGLDHEAADRNTEYDLEKLKILHEKFVKRSSRSKELIADEPKTDDVKASTSRNKHLIQVRSPTEDVPEVSVIEATGDSAEHSENELIAEDVDSDVGHVIEEPKFTHFEYVNKRYEPEQENGHMDDQLEMDLESIDKELDMALDQTTKPTVGQSDSITAPGGVPSSTTSSTELSHFRTDKRKATEDLVPEQFQAKKIKPDEETGATESSRRCITAEHIRTKMNDLSEIFDLSSTITDKLEFLEVTRTGLSKLQVLLLQIETRIEDWRVGALQTEHLLQKLRESCATLRQYESSATPPGWSCHWHRYEHFSFGVRFWAWGYVDS